VQREQKSGHVGGGEDPAGMLPAKSFDPARQVAGLTMPFQGLDVHRDEASQLRHSDGRRAQECRLQGVGQGR
jgi:hypothetical protein